MGHKRKETPWQVQNLGTVRRQRLYDAQRLAGFYDTGEVMTIKEAQKFVNQVLSHQKTKKLFEQYRFQFSTYPIKDTGRGW
jgi:hypothetical protein